MPPKRAKKTETEYAGTVPTTNTVQPKESDALKPSERLRLSYLTGQEVDTEAPRKDGFMYGVDPEYPEVDK